MLTIEKYENFSASDYYDAVTSSSNKVSEAVYYLLKHRLLKALGRVFELHGFGLEDHFDDTIDDFFLYLYDWGDGPPFAIFDNVRERQAFFGWIVGTYRNFLLNKAKDELKRREMMEHVSAGARMEEPLCDHETLAHCIATAIAYNDQELPPRNRFIFYRMLLTILDQKLALPQEVVALAMRMNPVTYRVCVNRLRKRLSEEVSNMQKGVGLPLDNNHQLMRNRLFQEFDRLYEALMPYYERVLSTLASASELEALRMNHGPQGLLMHEDLVYVVSHKVNAKEFYDRLKS